MNFSALRTLPFRLSVVRLDGAAAVPRWSLGGRFFSVTGTGRELSIVCETALVPDGATAERGWRALEVEGPLPFDEVGVLAGLSTVLADRGVSLFAVSTYDTDYVLVKEGDLDAALAALKTAGHALLP